MNIGDIVICKVEKIGVHSALVRIEGTNKQGIIPISEISSGWVKKISDHLEEGQIIPCKVLAIDRNIIPLSIKKVTEKEKRDAFEEYYKERKAERLINIVLTKTKVENIEEIKNKIKERYKSYSSLLDAIKNKDESVDDILTKKQANLLKNIISKSEKSKEYEFKAKLKLLSYEPNGIEIIKKVFEDESDFDVTYLAATEFLLKFKSLDPKTGEKEFNEKINTIIDRAKKYNCFVKLDIIKK
ncbi:MAG: S1 RNA-binding domain-containing protein [Candidatus Aenigmarchaeota archaeon]|nr:S1 RNA-binding domain-containing protein [Candidatus Aenigmarchaeota archaeon]